MAIRSFPAWVSRRSGSCPSHWNDFVGVSLGIRDSVLFVLMAGPEGKNQGVARSPAIYASIPSHRQRTKNVFSLGASTPVEPVLIEATQTTRPIPIFAASNRIGWVDNLRWGQTRDSGLALELLCVFSHCRPSSLLLHTEQAATLRFQRIDNRHRRRMFRPTAEIACTELLTKCPTDVWWKPCPPQNAIRAAGLSVV